MQAFSIRRLPLSAPAAPALWRARATAAFVMLGLLALTGSALAQERDPGPSPDDLKRMSIEELMSLEVTSVSKRPERLSETASAVQVITQEDLHRSAATSLPEALRLAPNVQAARLNSYAWVIGTRGFNALYANKLLVMIDGRSVYTPLFGGVMWDVQNVLLDDLERVEVVSGPGGTLWGANAVNGVVNIITRSAAETQGLLVSASAGSFLQDQVAARMGGQIGGNLYFRVYGQRFDRNGTFLPDGARHADAWRMGHGGVRLDWYASPTSVLTVQGDLYGGTARTEPARSAMDGQNAMATWTHTLTPDSDVQVQLYFDRTWRRDGPSAITDELVTYDLDLQHRFPLARRHSILWGAGYRLMESEIRIDTTRAGFLPPERTLHLFSGFVQDEIGLVPERLKLTAGAKLEHHTYTGFEFQPSARLAWTPDDWQTIWSAVSRAVRAPSRIDRDFYIPGYPVPPPAPSVAGGPDFASEKLVAYELGYRVQPAAGLSLSLSAFFNHYDDLYSVEALPGTQTYQIQNGAEGETWGAEMMGAYQPARWWRLRGGYTFLSADLRSKPGHEADITLLGNDPAHQALLHSMLDLPGGLQLDLVGRYAGVRPAPRVPAYFTFDARLAWVGRGLELSLVGQNLWERRHGEFGMPALQIPRSVYGKVTWRI